MNEEKEKMVNELVNDVLNTHSRTRSTRSPASAMKGDALGNCCGSQCPYCYAANTSWSPMYELKHTHDCLYTKAKKIKEHGIKPHEKWLASDSDKANACRRYLDSMRDQSDYLIMANMVCAYAFNAGMEAAGYNQEAEQNRGQ